MNWRKRSAGLTPEQGARTLVYLAESPAVTGESGGYYVDCQRVEPSIAARSDADALRLWQISAQLAGLDFTPSARRA
jgi:hypothetical protein